MSVAATPPSTPRAWTAEQEAQIALILTRYPTKRAAIMPVLWLAQDSFGWLDLDTMRLVGRTLELPPSHVHAVASFYTQFKKQPTRKHLLQVCHTLSCWLAGADTMVAHLERSLGVDSSGNSPDGLFTVMRVECLASCGSAPMMQVNDDFYERLTTEDLDNIIEALRRDGGRSLKRPEVDQWTHPRS